MQIFESVGNAIENLWRAANYDEDALPKIAEEVLKNAGLTKQVSVWEVAEWALGATKLPQQYDIYGKFGDPPITVYNAPRFVIDVYYWLEGTTSVHQHAFCGAFQVLHGSSLHSEYHFEEEHRVNLFAKTGKLSLKSCDLLKVGDTQQIHYGDKYIHSLFHLEQPSATIVVRTILSPLDLPQLSYFKPGLAIAAFFESADSIKKLHILTSAIKSDHPDADKYIDHQIRNNDFQTAYNILRELRPMLTRKSVREVFGVDETGARFQKFLSTLKAAHPKFAYILDDAFDEFRRLEEIVRLRNVVTSADHRFFLALLLNLDNRETILDLIGSRYPDSNPNEKMLDWISELANTRILDGSAPNGLGIEGFGDFDTIVIEEVLKGRSDSEVIETVVPYAGETENPSAKAEGSIKRIREARIFRPLLK